MSFAILFAFNQVVAISDKGIGKNDKLFGFIVEYR